MPGEPVPDRYLVSFCKAWLYAELRERVLYHLEEKRVPLGRAICRTLEGQKEISWLYSFRLWGILLSACSSPLEVKDLRFLSPRKSFLSYK